MWSAITLEQVPESRGKSLAIILETMRSTAALKTIMGVGRLVTTVTARALGNTIIKGVALSYRDNYVSMILT